uniref:Uncharacterized protein n=1 Tax=Oryza punctata TaxID=4537 RepID=A0A0E0LDS1_ORYPU
MAVTVVAPPLPTPTPTAAPTQAPTPNAVISPMSSTLAASASAAAAFAPAPAPVAAEAIPPLPLPAPAPERKRKLLKASSLSASGGDRGRVADAAVASRCRGRGRGCGLAPTVVTMGAPSLPAPTPTAAPAPAPTASLEPNAVTPPVSSMLASPAPAPEAIPTPPPAAAVAAAAAVPKKRRLLKASTLSGSGGLGRGRVAEATFTGRGPGVWCGRGRGSIPTTVTEHAATQPTPTPAGPPVPVPASASATAPSVEPNAVISPVASTLTASAAAAQPPAPVVPELATRVAVPLPEKPVLTAHDVAGPSNVPPSPPPRPPAASSSFFQVVIPPSGVQTNYAVHEAPDFDPNIYFADVPDGEQDELMLLSSTPTHLGVDTPPNVTTEQSMEVIITQDNPIPIPMDVDVDATATSSSLVADVVSSLAQAAVDVAVDFPSSSAKAAIHVTSSSARATIDIPSSSAQAAADVASSSAQGVAAAAENERPVVVNIELNEPVVEKSVLTTREVVMATLFPNGVFSCIVGPSHAPPPLLTSAASSVQTNYAIHESPDFNLNIFFADVPDGEQDELVLLSSTPTLLGVDTPPNVTTEQSMEVIITEENPIPIPMDVDVDSLATSSSLVADVVSSSTQAAIDIASSLAAVDFPSSSTEAAVHITSTSAQATIDISSSSAQVATDVASSSAQDVAAAAENERPVVFNTDLNELKVVPLLENSLLIAHEVIVATLFPNGVFSYIAEPSHAAPLTTNNQQFLFLVIPPGGVQINYITHDAPDFDPNIFFADDPNGKLDEHELLSSTPMLLDIDNPLDVTTKQSMKVIIKKDNPIPVPMDVDIDASATSSSLATDVASSFAQAAVDVASSSAQGAVVAAGNEMLVVFDFDLNEPTKVLPLPEKSVLTTHEVCMAALFPNGVFSYITGPSHVPPLPPLPPPVASNSFFQTVIPPSGTNYTVHNAPGFDPNIFFTDDPDDELDEPVLLSSPLMLFGVDTPPNMTTKKSMKVIIVQDNPIPVPMYIDVDAPTTSSSLVADVASSSAQGVAAAAGNDRLTVFDFNLNEPISRS